MGERETTTTTWGTTTTAMATTVISASAARGRLGLASLAVGAARALTVSGGASAVSTSEFVHSFSSWSGLAQSAKTTNVNSVTQTKSLLGSLQATTRSPSLSGLWLSNGVSVRTSANSSAAVPELSD